MYRIDQYGVVTNHSDIGFASIGSGGIHSSAHFMLLPYKHAVTYFTTLYQTFKAKKKAEADPSVGDYTDMFLINRFGATPVDRRIVDILEKWHKEDLEIIRNRPNEVEAKLGAEMARLFPPQPPEPPNSIKNTGSGN